jgi:hypothetical protein
MAGEGMPANGLETDWIVNATSVSPASNSRLSVVAIAILTRVGFGELRNIKCDLARIDRHQLVTAPGDTL